MELLTCNTPVYKDLLRNERIKVLQVVLSHLKQCKKSNQARVFFATLAEVERKGIDYDYDTQKIK